MEKQLIVCSFATLLVGLVFFFVGMKSVRQDPKAVCFVVLGHELEGCPSPSYESVQLLPASQSQSTVSWRPIQSVV
jgi:hypothetical protein